MVLAQLIVFIILLCILSVYNVYRLTKYDYVKSTLDGRYYHVRNLKDKQKSADELAELRNSILKLIDYMDKDTDKKEFGEYKIYVKRLKDKFSDVIITENLSEHLYTSYSINKGDKLVFCLRSRNKNTKNNLHDKNLIMYVVLHEISHIARPAYDIGVHSQEFKKILEYFIKCATEIGIYTKIDFQKNPKEYCGMTINNP